MNLQELHIDINIQDKLLIEIHPFTWLIGFVKRTYEAGDLLHYTISVLCFKLYYPALSAKGKEGKRYREGLRKSDEWRRSLGLQ